MSYLSPRAIGGNPPPEPLRSALPEKQELPPERKRVPADCPLSLKELRTLELLASGLVYKQIAAELFLSTSTVRTHLHHIYVKLGVHDRAEAVLVAAGAGWVTSAVSGDALSREEKLLHRIECLMEEFLTAIKERREQFQITLSQERYLLEFDRYLRGGSGSRTHRDRMTALLWKMLDEAGIPRDRVSSQRMSAGLAHEAG